MMSNTQQGCMVNGVSEMRKCETWIFIGAKYSSHGPIQIRDWVTACRVIDANSPSNHLPIPVTLLLTLLTVRTVAPVNSLICDEIFFSRSSLLIRSTHSQYLNLSYVMTASFVTTDASPLDGRDPLLPQLAACVSLLLHSTKCSQRLLAPPSLLLALRPHPPSHLRRSAFPLVRAGGPKLPRTPAKQTERPTKFPQLLSRTS